MKKIKVYLQSFRLRTLPLSVSGILLGTSAAQTDISIKIFIFNLLTAVLLQILANLANELGDLLHGTDTQQQNRKAYALQEGKISIFEMKMLIGIFCILSTLSGLTLLFVSLGNIWNFKGLIFILLGGFSIVAALKYTLGKRAYGYHYGGDLSVFVFFGLISVNGTFFLQTAECSMFAFWLSIAMGLLCVGVLNLNNIRDFDNDLLFKKYTVATLLGKKKATIYQAILLFSATIILILNGLWISLIALPVFSWHIFVLQKGKNLDTQMPLLSLSILFLSILCGIELLFC